MVIARTFRGLLSVLLTGALLFSFCTVGAAEETVPSTEATEPGLAQTEQTLPPETVEETLPAETLPPETLPQETTLPEETVPETTLPEQTEPVSGTPVSVRYAKTFPEGTDGVTLLGTVTFSGYGLTVLQDVTGGMVLTLPAEAKLSLGTVYRVTGMRTSTGLEVSGWEVMGTEPLTEKEATLSDLLEDQRVVIRGASYSGGFLIQEEAQLPLIPERPEGIRDGETVDVWGVAVGGQFYADTIRSLTAVPPQDDDIFAMPSDGILTAGQQITLHSAVEGTEIYYAYSYDGTFFSDEARYSGGISMDSRETSLYLRAYPVSPEGVRGNLREFFFTRPSAAGQSPASSAVYSASPAAEEDWNFYFGQLHAHTNLSDGAGSVEEAFQYAAQVPGLDFFAVTDHSDSFNDEKWQRGKAAAKAVTNGNFVGIFGYEMSFADELRLGHINTFRTDSWVAWNQEEYLYLENYYKTLKEMPGSISQFNHPGSQYGNFDGFGHFSPAYVESLQLLEVGSEKGVTAYEYYTMALNKGWRVAPTNNQNNHYGSWGDESEVRTVILAKSLSPDSVYGAMASRRVYATEDRDLKILYSVDGSIMGSVLAAPAQTAQVTVWDETDPVIGRVELIGDGETLISEENVASGTSLTLPISGDCSYYYLRINQPDGDMAVTAPVWVDLAEDMGIESFTASSKKPMEGDEIRLTLEFYNHELQPLELNTVEFFANGQSIYRNTEPGTAKPLENHFTLHDYTYKDYGDVTYRAVVTAYVAGSLREYSTELTLEYEPKPMDGIPVSIAEARVGEQGALYRVTGWVTAGNSNAYTRFPNMIFLQNETGGIAVTGLKEKVQVQVGTPLEIIGYLQEQDGNPVLKVRHARILEKEERYRYVPENQSNRAATDYSVNGGKLVQVSGQVITMERTENGQGVTWCILRDTQGNDAKVLIAPEILSGTYGTNMLATQVLNGRWVRAMGILWKDGEAGETVVRVRNCDEVVYVSPTTATTLSRPDPTNPKTGSREYRAPFGEGIPTPVLLSVLTITAAGLIALFRLKRKRK